MPELPEVETVRRGLEQLIIGKVIEKVEHDTEKSFPNAPEDVQNFLIGAKIVTIRRRAKVLLIDLSSEYTLVIHLKMTGQLVFINKFASSLSSFSKTASRRVSVEYASADTRAADVSENEASERLDIGETRFGAGHPNDSLVNPLPDKSTRVTFTFDDSSQLFFNDQRKFGWVKLFPTLEVPNIDFMRKVGPEPLEADFTANEFKERFSRRASTSIKAAILDQSVVAGVGNIYADESLWGAKIHPSRLVKSITDKEFVRLYNELRDVMNLAIEKGGSSNHTYVNAEGKKGSYMSFARVFRREGQACPRCGSEIIKLRVAGRGTHICPVCQVE